MAPTRLHIRGALESLYSISWHMIKLVMLYLYFCCYLQQGALNMLTTHGTGAGGKSGTQRAAKPLWPAGANYCISQPQQEARPWHLGQLRSSRGLQGRQTQTAHWPEQEPLSTALRGMIRWEEGAAFGLHINLVSGLGWAIYVCRGISGGQSWVSENRRYLRLGKLRWLLMTVATVMALRGFWGWTVTKWLTFCIPIILSVFEFDIGGLDCGYRGGLEAMEQSAKGAPCFETSFGQGPVRLRPRKPGSKAGSNLGWGGLAW